MALRMATLAIPAQYAGGLWSRCRRSLAHVSVEAVLIAQLTIIVLETAKRLLWRWNVDRIIE